MHDHRSSDRATDPVLPDAVRIRRLVLLELVVDPPVAGDALPDLARRLRFPLPAVERAVAELADAGLAERDGDVVRASRAALAFEALLPVAL